MILRLMCSNNRTWDRDKCNESIDLDFGLFKTQELITKSKTKMELLLNIEKENKYNFDRWLIDYEKEKIYCEKCNYKMKLQIKQRDCKHEFNRFWFDIADCHDSIGIYEICHICQKENTKTIMTPYEMITKLGIFKKNKEMELEDE